MRIFNVYGPRQNPESKYSLAIPGLLSKILSGQRPVIDGTGKQSRDFIYISDVLDAIFKILGHSKTYGNVYNLGSGKTTSINQLSETLLRLSRSSLRPIYGPRRAGDPEITCAAISKIYKDIGWKPKVTLDEGLKKVMIWAQK